MTFAPGLIQPPRVTPTRGVSPRQSHCRSFILLPQMGGGQEAARREEVLWSCPYSLCPRVRRSEWALWGQLGLLGPLCTVPVL